MSIELLIIGCEYAGSTTLAKAVISWATETRGAFLNVPDEYRIHDHFKFPKVSHPPEFSAEEHAQLMALSPRLKEMIQRHNVFYHLPHQGWTNDLVMIGLYFDDHIYGPLYFDYIHDLDPEDPIMQTRGQFETWLINGAPDVLLVQVKASPSVIRKRMHEDPRIDGVLQDKDVEYVLRRFDDEFQASNIPNKVTIDTTSATIEESLSQLVEHL